MITLRLAEPDWRYLQAHVNRLLQWDAKANARLVGRGSSLGLFAAPPFGVLSFAAVPVVAEGLDGLDRTVSLADFSVRMGVSPDYEIEVGPGNVTGVERILAVLPPSDGWQLPINAIAGDLMPPLDAAVQEIRRRASGASTRVAQQAADDVWDRIAWAGLPFRVLHAARALGFMGNDSSRVAAATSARWRRFTTNRGQIFWQAPQRGLRLAVSREHT